MSGSGSASDFLSAVVFSAEGSIVGGWPPGKQMGRARARSDSRRKQEPAETWAWAENAGIVIGRWWIWITTEGSGFAMS